MHSTRAILLGPFEIKAECTYMVSIEVAVPHSMPLPEYLRRC